MPRKGKPIPPQSMIRKPGSRKPATWRKGGGMQMEQMKKKRRSK